MQGVEPKIDFELTVARKVALYPRASSTVRLVFPMSTKFLRELSAEERDRLIRLGWDLPKTVHLGMPYFGAYPPVYEPTYSMLGLIIISEKGVYFRCVAWNTIFLDMAHDISIEESIHHEKLHITKDVEPRFREAIPLEWEQKLELGGEIKKESVSYIIKKYGRRAEDILEADGIKRYEEQARGKTILGNVLSFWLRRYFREKFDKCREYSFELTPKLKSSKVFQGIEADELTIRGMYEKQFGFRVE